MEVELDTYIYDEKSNILSNSERLERDISFYDTRFNDSSDDEILAAEIRENSSLSERTSEEDEEDNSDRDYIPLFEDPVFGEFVGFDEQQETSMIISNPSIHQNDCIFRNENPSENILDHLDQSKEMRESIQGPIYTIEPLSKGGQIFSIYFLCFTH